MSLSRPPRVPSASAKAAPEAGAARTRGARRDAAAPPAALAALRADFVAAVARDTPGSDLARYTEVLDELLAWGAAHADRFTAGPAAATTPGVIVFTPVGGATGPRWSVRPVRGEGPVVEILPAAGALQEAQVARVRELFNVHSRAVLGPDARLRIGFGALKNAAARAALLAMLEELVEADPTAPPSP